MRLKLVLFLAIAVNLIAATAPFRLELPEKVENRLEKQQDGSLVFRQPSMARSAAPPIWVEDAIRTGSVSLELRLTPASSNQGGPARILAMSQGYLAHNFVIGQQGTDLVIRLRRDEAHADGQPPFIVNGVFEAGRTRELFVRVEPGRLHVDVDRKLVLDSRLPEDALRTWDTDYRLALGNEVTGHRPWNGRIERARISTPAHRYDLLAAGNLQVPEQWWEVPVRLHMVSAPLRPEDVFVALVHFLAFLPVGYAAAGSYLQHRRGLAWAICLTFALAVGIEASKVLIESRHPTVLNFLANFAGGLAGVLAFWKVHAMRQMR